MRKTFEQKIPHHQYSVGIIQLLLQLVFDGANHLRTSARSMKIIGALLPGIETGVSYYSVRLWAMRLGYYELTRSKEKADDWVWIIDHSIQLSHEKCFLIVGFRLSTYGEERRPLKHRDLSLISLEVVNQSNGTIVCEQLQKAVDKTGVPRAIIHDHGSELKAGVTKFQKQNPGTAGIYDIKHKIAIEIKYRLEQDAQWDGFNKVAASIDKRLRQTAYADLTPPSLRNKARYMNLDSRVEWAQNKLKLIDTADEERRKELDARIGELKDYREDIQRWSEMLAITGYVENFSRHQWLSQGCEIQLCQDLSTEVSIQHTDNQALAQTLTTFIREQSSSCRENEHLPNSSEVLESLFGKQKYLEGEHSNRGFSGLVLSIGAMVSDLSTTIIKKALQTVPVKQVVKWQKEFPGATLQARQLALNSTATAEQKVT